MKTALRQQRSDHHGIRFAVVMVVLCALLFPAPAASKQENRKERLRIARQQMRQAKSLQTKLKGKSPEKNHLKVAQTYKRVYNIAPFSGLAADALNARAGVYHDMGARFGKSYWKKSIEVYRFLRKEYPHSEYRGTALFNIAQIQDVHLKDRKTALKTYRSYLKNYPEGTDAGKVKKAVRAIEKRQEVQRARAKARRKDTPAAVKSKQPKQPEKTPVQARGKRGIIKNIRYWNTEGYTRVVVDIDHAVEYQSGRVGKPDRIFFDLFNTELGSDMDKKKFQVKAGLLNRIRVAENRSGVTRVVLDVNDVKDYSVFTLPNPFRLVVDIHSSAGKQTPPSQVAKTRPSPKPSARERAAATPAPTPKAPLGTDPAPAVRLQNSCGEALTNVNHAKPASNGNHTLSRALGLKVNRIVLDPGHGGNDHGTTGPTGLKEKELVLDIARRLGKRLEKELCAEVIYTRSKDRFIPLESRAPFANQKQADLFVSIHANYSRNRGVRGVETYYLNFTSNPEALNVAARENALSQRSMHDLQDIIRKISRNEKIQESRELAAHLQRQLSGRLRRYSKKIRNRGVRKAPFVVLIGANMPAVLAEISFISNRSDEKHLKSRKGRDRVVDGLYRGIAQYLKDINGLSIAQATD